MLNKKRRKYSKTDIDNIYLRALTYESYGDIAKDYGVSKNAIAGIVFRKRNPGKKYIYI